MNTHILKVDSNLKLYKRQRDIMFCILPTDPNRGNNWLKYIIVCTGRQIGKSLLGEVTALFYLLNTSRDIQESIGYITPYYSQGKKVFRSIEKKLLNIKKSYPILDVTINKSDLLISYRWGKDGQSNELKFLSADNYDAIRGNTFTKAIIDEAAFISDEAWESAIKPTLLVKCNKCLMLSTPKGKNWFYNEWLKGKPSNPKFKTSGYISFNFSSYQNPYIDPVILDEWKLTMSPNRFREEILGEFLEDGGEVFTNISSLIDISNTIAITDKNQYYAGIDIASSDDYTVLTVIDKDGNIVEVDRFNKMNFRCNNPCVCVIVEALKIYTFLSHNPA